MQEEKLCKQQRDNTGSTHSHARKPIYLFHPIIPNIRTEPYHYIHCYTERNKTQGRYWNTHTHKLALEVRKAACSVFQSEVEVIEYLPTRERNWDMPLQ